MYSLKHKLYISQLTENQRDAESNVGFVYSLYSFLFPLLFMYIDPLAELNQCVLNPAYGFVVNVIDVL